jgi:hypothetical protein
MKADKLRAIVDEYDSVKEQRLALDRASNKLKEIESAAKVKLMAALAENNLTSLGGTNATFTLVSKDLAVAKSWPDIYNYIQETGEFDLLMRKLMSNAVLSRLDDGIIIPGTDVMSIHELSRRGN